MTVLVIEAGPVDWNQDGILTPGNFQPWWYFYPGLETVPHAGLNNRTPDAIAAQVVGGGSVINAMVYLRGDANDYDAWGALGNPGWSWKNMLPYFKKVRRLFLLILGMHFWYHGQLQETQVTDLGHATTGGELHPTGSCPGRCWEHHLGQLGPW